MDLLSNAGIMDSIKLAQMPFLSHKKECKKNPSILDGKSTFYQIYEYRPIPFWLTMSSWHCMPQWWRGGIWGIKWIMLLLRYKYICVHLKKTNKANHLDHLTICCCNTPDRMIMRFFENFVTWASAPLVLWFSLCVYMCVGCVGVCVCVCVWGAVCEGGVWVCVCGQTY